MRVVPGLLCALLLAAASPAAAEQCALSRVVDGDTLIARCAGESVRVRLACIDAPEASQRPYGPQAAAALRSLAGRGAGAVFLRGRQTGRYGRRIATVEVAGEDLNLALVEQGRAAVYPRYCENPAYYDAEDRARAAGRGVWAEPGLHQTPWEYRK